MAKKKLVKKKTAKAKSIGGPFVNAAFICEKVLKEEGVPTFVRVIDTFHIAGTTPQMPPGIIQFVMILMFKSGDARGTKKMHVTCFGPSGKMPFESNHALNFRGGETGAGVEAEINLGIKEAGTYWFIATINGKVMTKIPVRIVYQRVQRSTGQQTESSVPPKQRRKLS